MQLQYIGARYVPRFMGTYDNTQAYEALDVVDNGLGTSYISKVPTPPNTPLTDTDYWALYGASNGAIVNLQNQIDTINNITIPGIVSDVNDLATEIATYCESLINKKIYIIGDSVSDPNILTDNWAEQLKTKLAPLTTDVTYSGISGASITYDNNVQVASLNTRFDNTSKDMDILIIELGVNDWILNHSLADIAGELALFINNINSLANPPIVYWIMPFKNKDPRTSMHPLWLDIYRSYYAYFASSNGIRIIDGANVPILNTMNSANIAKYFLNDTYDLHPNQLGSKYICDYVFKKLISGGDNALTPFLTYFNLNPYKSSANPFTMRTFNLTFDSFGNVKIFIEGYGTTGSVTSIISSTLEPFKYLNSNYPLVYSSAACYDANHNAIYGTFKLENGVIKLECDTPALGVVIAFSGEITFNNSAVYDNYGTIA